MNDLFSVSEFIFTILYADDTCVLMNGKHLEDLVTRMQKELNLLYTWLQANKLSLNGQKTYYIIFHRARIKLASHTYDLYIDDKITWIPHITYVKNKVSKGIGIMFKARHYLKRNALVNLYNSFIYPYLIYCIEAWGNATNCHLKQLYLIQKKAIRMITFANYNAPSIDIFNNLNVLPLDKLVVDRICVMMYKYANDLLPPALNYLYTSNSDVHNYTTRPRHLLHVNKSNINTYTNSFGNASARIWNVLQSKIKINISLSKFKMSLKLYLQENSLQLKYTK